VTAEIPKTAQQSCIGIASRVETGAAGATLIGAGCDTVAGSVLTSGCVFVIFTVGATCLGGSGRMLIRAVSFLGIETAAGCGAAETAACVELEEAAVVGGRTARRGCAAMGATGGT